MKTLLRCLLLALALSSRARADSGGPDAGGYAFDHANAAGGYSTIVNVAGALRLTAAGTSFDDNTLAASIGFPFRYYGQNYSTVSVCTNGFVILGSSSSTSSGNTSLLSAGNLPSGPALCPFWDDLTFNSASPGAVWTLTRVVNGKSEFVVEWDRPFFFTSGTQGPTFQLILRADGSITYLYPDVPGTGAGGTATIGLRKTDGTDGKVLQPSFNTGYLNDGDRIDFFARPANDDEADALDFSGAVVSPQVNTAGASKEGTDPVVSGAENRSVWFNWKAPADGQITFSTAGSSYDTVMAVKDAGSDTVVGTNDDTANTATSLVGPLACAENQVFKIMVAGFGTGGLAQVTASFAPAERVHFFTNEIFATEGREVKVAVQREGVNPGPLSVNVRIYFPDGTDTLFTISAAGSGPLTPLSLTPLDDAVFTPGRSYTFIIEPKPGQYVVTLPDITTLKVFDNDAPLLPARSYLGVLTSRVGHQLGNGLVSVTMGKTGAFTGRLSQAGATFAFKGLIDGSGKGEVLIPRKGLAPLQVTVFVLPGGETINVVVDGPDRAGDVFGLAALTFNAKHKVPPALVGRYTLLGTGNTIITGYNYGTGTVSATGAVKFAGVLADGTPNTVRFVDSASNSW